MGACPSCGAPLPDGARFCPSCGAPAESGGPAAEERKLATVLFADLVGSTELASSEDPERTRVTLDRFYDAMAAEIDRAGGTLEKFVGDAVMAVFGAPAAKEDHAERALHAALAMQRRLDRLFGDRLQMRIGVNTGEVVTGRARDASSFVSGDPVNVGARLEQNAAPGEILVGERTAAVARGAFEFGEPARIEAKGKKEGIRCRRLIRALSLMRPRGVGGLRRAFVGRGAELDLLASTYRRAVHDGEPHLVTIVADAGVGKSRLVRELWERLGAQPEEPLRRVGRCLPYGRAITYWPLGEILKEHLGILESDPPDVVAARLGARQELAPALGLDVDAGHPLAARERLHEGWVEFVQELVSERPTVVLVEDLHWAEEPLLDVFERVVREVRGPLLLIGTARPELLEQRPAWSGGRRNASLLWLEPLSVEEAERLVDEELAGALPAALRSLVVEHAEGNPFFVEELIGTLIDQRVLERTHDGGWLVRALPEGFEVPDSVHAVLAARIDLLPRLEKAGLQAASVIGRVFWEGPVRELLEGAAPDFALLEDRDFVRRRPGSSIAGEREYAVKHALTREVAYSSLPKARRARLHAAFADWLERTAAARDEVASLFAHHYAEAVRPEDVDLAWAAEPERLEALRAKAVAWLRRAAELAVARYELGDAVELLRRALALEPAAEEQAEIWRELGHAHALGFDGEAFWEAMQNSLAVCVDRSVCADTYSMLAFQTVVRSGMWRRRPERELVDGWIEQALALSEPGTATYARALVARANWADEDDAVDTARVAGAAAAARDASAVADQLGDPSLRSWAFEARAAVAAAAGRYDEAWTWAQRRVDLLPLIDDPDHVMEIHESLAPASAGVGRLREARRIAEAGDARAAPLSPHHRVHGISLRLEVAELAGDWEAVRALRARAEETIAANLDTPCARNVRSMLVCAAASAYLGDLDEAERLELAAQALRMEGYDYAFSGPRLRLALARSELGALGPAAAASAGHGLTFGLATTSARLDALAALRDRERVEAEAPPLLRAGTYLEPFAVRALGLVRDDEELLRSALARFHALGLGWHAEQTPLLAA